MTLAEVLQYGFIQRALIAGVLIAVLCAVLGVFLVLRRLSLIGDGLSHVTFGSVALVLLLGASPLYVSLAAIPLVMASSVGILKLAEKARIFGDAAIGIVSSLGIATGVLLAAATGGFNIDLFSYLFGNILTVSPQETALAALLFVVVMAAVAARYRDLFAVTFDDDLAAVSGVRTNAINQILVLLVALVTVLAMKVVGIMLVSALLILPPVAAMQVARGFRTTLAVAAFFSSVSVVAGIALAFFLNLPAGASIIVMNFLFFVAASGVRRLFS